jgi:hypothetical protein
VNNEQYVSLSRRFVEIQSTDFDNEPDSIWASLASREKGKTWEEILADDISILLGTAGSGKTTEIRQHVKRLVGDGKDAFLMRLEALQEGNLENSFDFELDDQRYRFEKWKRCLPIPSVFAVAVWRICFFATVFVLQFPDGGPELFSFGDLWEGVLEGSKQAFNAAFDRNAASIPVLCQNHSLFWFSASNLCFGIVSEKEDCQYFFPSIASLGPHGICFWFGFGEVRVYVAGRCVPTQPASGRIWLFACF